MKTLIILFLLCFGSLYAQVQNWVWVQTASGSSTDRANAICTDNYGNSYITGTFSSSCHFGGLVASSQFSAPVFFVAKIDSEGNWLWVVTPENASSISQSYAIAIDNEENVYVTGYYSGTLQLGDYIFYDNASADIFVLKLSNEGEVIWAVRGGGIDFDAAYSIAIDNAGYIVIAGDFSNETIIGTDYLQGQNLLNIFVAKLNPAGNWLWARQASSSIGIQCAAVTAASSGGTYITGRFSGTGSFGEFITSNSSGYRTFVAKLDYNGNWLYANEIISQNSNNSGTSLRADQYGNCYVTGSFSGGIIVGSNALNSAGPSDIFVAKLDPNGQWVWGNSAGSNGVDVAYGLELDENSELVIAGNFSNVCNFGDLSLSTNGNTGVFIAGVNQQGNWIWAIQAETSYNVSANGVAITSNSEVMLAGSYSGYMTFGTIITPIASMWDIFVAKLQRASSVMETEILDGPNFLMNPSPNPFSHATSIGFFLKENLNTLTADIYNVKGQKVKTYSLQNLRSGTHTITWDGISDKGNKVPKGVYFIHIREDIHIGSRKMILY